MTPNQIGSKPIESKIGPMTGTTTKVISIKSRIKPSKNMTSITTKSAMWGPPPSSSKKPSISVSPPKPRKTSENTAAPISIRNTMLVVWRVDREISRSTSSVSAPRTKASSRAPVAPTPAASVGVAAPTKIEPKTRTINPSGGSTALIAAPGSAFSTSAGGA